MFTFPEPAIATTPLEGVEEEERRLRWELTLWKNDWVVERERELSFDGKEREGGGETGPVRAEDVDITAIVVR